MAAGLIGKTTIKVKEQMDDKDELSKTNNNKSVTAEEMPEKQRASWKLYALLLLILNAILLIVVLVFVFSSSEGDTVIPDNSETNFRSDVPVHTDSGDMHVIDELRRKPEANRGRVIKNLTLEVWMIMDNGDIWCKVGAYPKQLDVIITGPDGSSYREAVAHGGVTPYYEEDVMHLDNNAKFIGLSAENFVVIEIYRNRQEVEAGYGADRSVDDYSVYDNAQGERKRRNIGRFVYPGQYPEVSMNVVSHNYLYGRAKRELRLMRNEIFARHGYRFKSPDLLEYFIKMNWYKAKYDDVSTMLTDIERANIKLIKQYE